MSTCKVCSKPWKLLFKKNILNKYEAEYRQCNNCEFLGISNVHWLDEAYSEAINSCDTGLIERCLYNSKITSILLFFFYPSHARILDFAGGHGVFTRLMRDIGFHCFWSDEFAKNIHSIGFQGNLEDRNTLLTSFESFEHFDDPAKELAKLLNTKTDIFFSTSLYPKNVEDFKKWPYLGLNHGQHISFYSLKTLDFIAQKYGYYLYTDKKSYHLLSRRKFLVNPITISKVVKKLGAFQIIKKVKQGLTEKDSTAQILASHQGRDH